MPDPRPDLPLLLRYLAGDASPGERARVVDWLSAGVDRQVFLESLRSGGQGLADGTIDVERAWARMRADVRRDDPVDSVGDRRTPVPPAGDERGGPEIVARRSWSRGVGGHSLRPLSAIAVVFLIALGASLLVVHSMSRRAERPMPGREYATAAGQRLSVTLIDGTRLTLAPASRVQVAADYGHPVGAREVELEGEAYFAVVHDATHPFAVRANEVVARDVGTAFDVRAYPEDVGARVAVTEGAVAVAAVGACRIALDAPCRVETRAGDVATVGESGVTVEHGVDVAALTAWTEGRLIFRKTRFSEAARELARRYDLNVRVADSALGAESVTNEFNGDSLGKVLTILGMSLDARVERHGRTVLFTRMEGK